jgi:hypothetical protein
MLLVRRTGFIVEKLSTAIAGMACWVVSIGGEEKVPFSDKLHHI